MKSFQEVLDASLLTLPKDAQKNIVEPVVKYLLALSYATTLTVKEIPLYASSLDDIDQSLLSLLKKNINVQGFASETYLTSVLDLLNQKFSISESDSTHLKQVLRSLLHYLKQTEILLSIGGDDRLTLHIEQNKQNKYLSTTLPRPDVIRRGSCTCSTIDSKGYEVAETARCEILSRALALSHDKNLLSSYFDQLQQDVIQRLSKVLNLQNGKLHQSNNKYVQNAQIVLFPSGSDAEYLPLVAGLVRSHSLAKGQSADIKVFNYVIANGEVGSGTPNAATGQHFSPLAPNGKTQKAGNYLEGIEASHVQLVSFKPRDANGLVHFQEESIAQSIQTNLRANSAHVAILHLVCGSKTGLIYPSMNLIDKLQAEFPQQLLVVIDACQLRCQLSLLQEYLAKGFLCLITGSKFFTGPPFSGGVLLPANIANELETHVHEQQATIIPRGLVDYITSFEVSQEMKHLRHWMQTNPAFVEGEFYNLGLYLRWIVALPLIESYHQLSIRLVEEFTRLWIENIQFNVRQYSPFLLELKDSFQGFEGQNIGNINSIVSFEVFTWTGELHSVNHAQVLRTLTADEYKEFHRLLTLSTSSPTSISTMLGQPVKLSDKGKTVLRIALGADHVVNTLTPWLQQESSSLLSEDQLIGLLRKAFQVNQPLRLLEEKPVNSLIIEKIARMKHENALVVAKINELSYKFQLPYVFPSLEKTFPKKTMIQLDQAFHLNYSTSLTTPLRRFFSLETLQQTFPILPKVQETENDEQNVMILYDLNALEGIWSDLQTSFTSIPKNQGFIHCFAIKSCPLPFVLHQIIQRNGGLECASIGEVTIALNTGCSPDKIVFDSPCKTISELRFALQSHVRINCNSLHELEKIAQLIKTLVKEENIQTQSKIGLRVNPLVGAGNIEALSTSTLTSKFGVPLFISSPFDWEKDIQIQHLVSVFETYPFLSGLMCHVGSQGMPIELMIQGVERIVQLANLIDKKYQTNRVQWIDIGGGLSANYNSDEITPSFHDYAQGLLTTCPDLFTREVLSEFGKAIITKSGLIASKIEDILDHGVSPGEVLPTVTAISHAGADLLLRTAYCPDKFPHRISLLHQSTYDEIVGQDKVKLNVVGPLCFSGDVMAKGLEVPRPQAGDWVVLHDTGANTLSLFSKHCSRASPKVFGIYDLAYTYAHDVNQEIHFQRKLFTLRQKETMEEVLSFWE